MPMSFPAQQNASPLLALVAVAVRCPWSDNNLQPNDGFLPSDLRPRTRPR